MPDALLDAPLVQSIGWALIHFVWQGTAIGIATAIALRALAGVRPTMRYAVACFSLTLMLIVPILAVLADRESDSLAVASFAAAAPDVVPPVRFERLLPSAVVVWLTGVFLLSARLVVAWIGVERLKTATRAVDATIVARVQLLAQRFGIDRTVRLFECTLVRVPTVVGCLRPVILLPASVITGLAPEHLDAVLAHELAHVRRHDYFVNVLQSLVETLLFYHPAVWWCSRQIRIEREHCCDDMVVEAGGNRVAYAAALAQLEEMRGLQPMLSLNASGGRLVDRIRRLLGESPTKERRSATWTIAAAMALVTAIVVTPARSVVDASELVVPPPSRDYVRETQAALETLARETQGVVVFAQQASPQSQQAKPQPAPRPQAQPTPQPNSQPEIQATPQPPQPPLPPSSAAATAPQAPPAPPSPAPFAPAPPLPPNSQAPVAAPAPPAPPAPPVEPLSLDPDAIHEALKGAMQQLADSLQELRRATDDVAVKQEAIRQAQAEIAKMRIDTLATRTQMEVMQKALDELNEELSRLRGR